jgi:hypothetical protein
VKQIGHLMDPGAVTILFERALCEVADVMARGAQSHPGDDWASHPPSEHIEHAAKHLELLAAGDTSDSHLRNATCRLLMAMSVPID